MRNTLLCCCLLLVALPSSAAEYHYHFGREAKAVYQDVMRLELDLAEAGVRHLKKTEPRNLAAYHLESYIDFFRLYLSGDEGLDAALAQRFDQRVAKLEQGDSNSPYYHYALAEVRLHRSLIELRFERHLAAFRQLNRAYKHLRDNVDRFPDFLLTYKDLGLLHAAVGSIPPQYKWGVELLSSLSGTVNQGRRELKRALTDTASPFHLETQVLYAFMELHLADRPELAYKAVKPLGLRPAENNLHCFILATLAMRTDRNAEAIALLEKQQRGGTVADFPYLDFLLGQAKLRNLNPQARIHFKSFLLRYPGRHFREEALQKIAWSYLLQGDEVTYHRTMREIEGGSRDGGDENAIREAAHDRAPNLHLLRARLLFDGGYFTRARAELDAVNTNTLTAEEKLEHRYRTGRVLDGLGDAAGALSFYERTIDLGRDHPAYYACNAALQAGLLEEKRGNEAVAARYFRTCLSINPAEYRIGLHMMAKAGLDRVGGSLKKR
ncbi:hypothetical protein GGR26_002933 [Lewinella marina]|uniref:Tetratricopeptide repeat protein n=1 Tax=Neolewinella marina TaxID=438751 RepID=A0A2G0CBK6_9BACT|nr:hypothetical protein [Neolewinella marina]NJB87156.1 hypothetical protein [Neolewinella marina]PHK97317.1 hypothetical protein CGL56_16050 [Neolewinella marina]